eukprot:jgi/Mesvir1/12636/Mv02192-RA.1
MASIVHPKGAAGLRARRLGSLKEVRRLNPSRVYAALLHPAGVPCPSTPPAGKNAKLPSSSTHVQALERRWLFPGPAAHKPRRRASSPSFTSAAQSMSREADKGDQEVFFHASQDFSFEELARLHSRRLQALGEPDSTAAASQADRLTREAQGQLWEEFHGKHQRGRQYHERRYLLREFPLLATCGSTLEIGCGTGSSVLPILRGNPGAMVYACDLSSKAIEHTAAAVAASGITGATERLHLTVADPCVLATMTPAVTTDIRHATATPAPTGTPHATAAPATPAEDVALASPAGSRHGDPGPSLDTSSRHEDAASASAAPCRDDSSAGPTVLDTGFIRTHSQSFVVRKYDHKLGCRPKLREDVHPANPPHAGLIYPVGELTGQAGWWSDSGSLANGSKGAYTFVDGSEGYHGLFELTKGRQVDAVLLVFTLSSILPPLVPALLRGIRDVLVPGTGRLLVRDYGPYDMRMLGLMARQGSWVGDGAGSRARRTAAGGHAVEGQDMTSMHDHCPAGGADDLARLDGARSARETRLGGTYGDLAGQHGSDSTLPGRRNSFLRGNGIVQTYYFREELMQLCADAGFSTDRCEYGMVRLRNRRTQEQMDRVFLRGEFAPA